MHVGNPRAERAHHRMEVELCKLWNEAVGHEDSAVEGRTATRVERGLLVAIHESSLCIDRDDTYNTWLSQGFRLSSVRREDLADRRIHSSHSGRQEARHPLGSLLVIGQRRIQNRSIRLHHCL
nr:hypothetical protein JVH1_4017 [Rhodococcus sp. JVH1]